MSTDPTSPAGSPAPDPLTVTVPVPTEILTHRSKTTASSAPARVGHFVVLRTLGEGGMGVVYEASDSILHRVVALKILRPDLARSPESKARFLREARAAAAINHDHVVTIYHVDEDDGVPFMAMELLQGETLEDRMNRPRTMPVRDCVQVGRQVAEALAAAHSHGLIHRDVKPSNIWLQAGTEVRVVLLDFGLALDPTNDIRLTQTGYVMGTPAYMSPEQTRAWPLDSRTDLFSLGCVLYEALAGKRPFNGDTLPQVARSLQVDTPPPLARVRPDVPTALSDLVGKLLGKERESRPASAAAVANALRDLELSLLPRTAPTAKRRRWPYAIGALVVAFVAVAAYFLGYHRGTVIVECDDPAIHLRLRAGDVVHIERTNDREFTLPPGDYTIEPTTDHPGVVAEPSEIHIDSGATTRVRIHKRGREPFVFP